jgi:DNA-binding response OmpR family regulator
MRISACASYHRFMRILIVEDDATIAGYLKRGLEERGYAVDAVNNGRDALDWAIAAPYDLILLDVMLPEMNGIDVCRELRKRNLHMPVLMLTARDTVNDRVAGLDAGADDYLVKPFAMPELLARLRALTRRAEGRPRDTTLQVGDLMLDTSTHRVQRAGQSIELTAKEFAVLEYLMREAGRVLTRNMIAEHVWNFDDVNQSNVVDVYIRNLRRKIDDPSPVKLIQTVRGTGYRIDSEGTREAL